ncbi:DUF916 and DUF3324 domain-containing protein [Marinilactibacillus kalidii]|uniref:DUF916 and DUF3324 domain-containing protein n=1 Tax=Marinilactibacillus kalidii TaxID=2820274 RepID=UPI001ABE24B2|nr:DUF916 and DUF3324 domain-containing protein [Marinilactibacillus kalidii]
MNVRQHKHKLNKKIGFLTLLLMMIFFSTSDNVQANEDMLGFYIDPIFPDSQVEDSNSYFDLNIEPGEEETLEVKVRNATSDVRNIEISSHTAFTNVHGVVEYGKTDENPDSSLSHKIEEVLEVPEQIELKGNEEKIISIPLKMPKESFEGVMAGGLRVQEVSDKELEDASEEGLAIKNKFSYVIGIVISNNRSFIEPDLTLQDVFADQLNYRNVISATIQNYTPTFVNKLAVDAKVKRAGEEDILYKAQNEDMQMAPNSHFDFPISLEGDRFKSGDYVLDMTARSGENEWTWQEEFTIEADTARSFNREDVTIDSGISWWVLGTVLLICVLTSLVIYLFWKNKKDKDSN